MADVNFFDNFETQWAQNGGIETIDENQYRQGWAFIGSTPPSVEQFNRVQQLNDQKAAWLFAQVKALAAQGGYELAMGMGDALVRGIASSMQAGTGVVGVDTGEANAYIVNYTPAVTALHDGMTLWFKVSAANTGASTLNVNGLGVRSIIGMGHAPLRGGELVGNGKALAVWKADSNSWVLVGCSGGGLQVAPASAESHAMQLGQATGRLLCTTIYTRVAGVQSVSVDGSTPRTAGATTFAAQPGTSFAEIEVIGGGGGSGGTPATNGTQQAMSGGGGGGAYGVGRYSDGLSGVPVTVGTAGSAGTAGASAGGSGGASSFGALLSAAGGTGSLAGAVNSGTSCTASASGGSTVSGANMVSSSGGRGGAYLSAGIGFAVGGDGGISGKGFPQGAGAGGAGRYAGINQGVLPGYPGFAGAVIVREYA